MLTGCQDHKIRDPLRNRLAQPEQVPHIGVPGGGGELDLDPDATAVVALDDQIDLMPSPIRPEVRCGGLRRLGQHTDRQRGQAFEQRSQKTTGVGGDKAATEKIHLLVVTAWFGPVVTA